MHTNESVGAPGGSGSASPKRPAALGGGGNSVRSSIHGGSRVLKLPDGTLTRTNDPYFNPPGSVELQRVP